MLADELKKILPSTNSDYLNSHTQNYVKSTKTLLAICYQSDCYIKLIYEVVQLSKKETELSKIGKVLLMYCICCCCCY